MTLEQESEKIDSNLLGFVRLSKKGNALNISLCLEAVKEAKTYEGQDGTKYVSAIINLKHVDQLKKGEKEVSAITQIVD